MSNETKDLNTYQYTSPYIPHNNINSQSLPYVSGPCTYNANMISSQIGADLYSCPQGAFGFGFELPPSSTEFFNPSTDQENGFYNKAYNYDTNLKSYEVVGGGGAMIENETRVSASPSSSEADHHHREDSGKKLMKRETDGRGDDQRSQKVSYYRCTTQKCNVKKRFERSYQDPTVVITTYESQHNHLIPISRLTAMFSGPAASDYKSSSSLSPISDFNNTPRSFSHDDLFRAPYSSVNANRNYKQQQN